MAKRRKTGWKPLWAVIGVAAVVGLVWAGLSGRDGGASPAQLVSDAQLGAERNRLGRAAAPVTVIEFGDYQ